jgi:putative NIF3 family GTP cyclohydrolase 1 type 2
MQVDAVIAALKAAAGAKWQDPTWDGLHAGTLEAEVTGAAVAWSPTLDVLKRATAAACNLLLTKAPLYWSEGQPGPSGAAPAARFLEGSAGGTPFSAVEPSALYRQKREFVTTNGLNVFRVTQNWNGPEGLPLRGLLDALQWKAQTTIVADSAAAPLARTAIVSLTGTPLRQLAEQAKQRTGARCIRVIGDSGARIARAAVHPGYLTVPAIQGILSNPGIDLVVTGEACEWEAFPYAQDWIDTGQGKGFMMLGLAVSSDASARAFADWVRATVAPLRVEHLAAGDPFTAIHAGAIRK